MFKCVDENCGIWNYEKCLVSNVLDSTYCKSLTGWLHGDREGRKKKVNEEASMKKEPKEEPSKFPEHLISKHGT
jgi:hypothetical protein